MMAWKGTVARGFTAKEFTEYCLGLRDETWDWRPKFIVLHNTAIPTFANWHDVPGEQRMREFTVYFRDQQRWSGGPHLFIADDRIWVFTPLTLPGVHSPSWNDVSWGVEVVG